MHTVRYRGGENLPCGFLHEHIQRGTAQLWQWILGHMAFMEWLILHDCLRMQIIQWQLKIHWPVGTDNHTSLILSRSAWMTKHGESKRGSFCWGYPIIHSFFVDIYWYVEGGMGCSLLGVDILRCMVRWVSWLVHQYPGDELSELCMPSKSL